MEGRVRFSPPSLSLSKQTIVVVSLEAGLGTTFYEDTRNSRRKRVGRSKVAECRREGDTHIMDVYGDLTPCKKKRDTEMKHQFMTCRCTALREAVFDWVWNNVKSPHVRVHATEGKLAKSQYEVAHAPPLMCLSVCRFVVHDMQFLTGVADKIATSILLVSAEDVEVCYMCTYSTAPHLHEMCSWLTRT